MSDTRDLLRRTAEIAADYLESLGERPVFPQVTPEQLREALGGPLLLLAGGSGIVPLRSMLRHHAATESRVPVRLLYSARTIEDVIYQDELAQYATLDDVEIRFALTRAWPEGWQGYRRRIDRAMLEEVAWPPSATALVYE
jgi:ferredoxin-NADP reductase